jgi:predicted permease
MVGATIGESGLPMVIGFLLEAFGPGSLPWTIFLFAIAQVVIYIMLHIIGTSASHQEHSASENRLMDKDTDEYFKISLDVSGHDEEEEDIDTNHIEMVSL